MTNEQKYELGLVKDQVRYLKDYEKVIKDIEENGLTPERLATLEKVHGQITGINKMLHEIWD